MNKFNDLHKFIEERNPLLLEEWTNEKIKESKKEADKILSNDT